MYEKTPVIDRMLKNNLLIPLLAADAYKIGHPFQTPKGLESIYLTFTPRTTRVAGVDHVMSYGAQRLCKAIFLEYFEKSFFGVPEAEVVEFYEYFIYHTLSKFGNPEAKVNSNHIRKLHQLGYLPIEVRSIPEGMFVPLRVPMATFETTHKDFPWVTTFFESLNSSEWWKMPTIATLADRFKRKLIADAKATGGDLEFINFQGHDFSLRGLDGLDSGRRTGSAHLLSFTGTDNLPGIFDLMKYYNGDISQELIGTSIPATEHSIVMIGTTSCSEEVFLERLITEIYPEGFVSAVFDTTDFWGNVEFVLPRLKSIIMARNGKLVVRPDSGDPADILCGDSNGKTIVEQKGLIQVLWEIFGGTITTEGFKLLDSHIGAIYGDAINYEKMAEIHERLMDKGFATTNVVYGIGSYSYQGYVTRDTFGFAMKPTSCSFSGGIDFMLQKKPKTGDGVKISNKGYVAVKRGVDGKMFAIDNLTRIQYENTESLLVPIFRNGKLLVDCSVSDIKKNIAEEHIRLCI